MFGLIVVFGIKNSTAMSNLFLQGGGGNVYLGYIPGMEFLSSEAKAYM